MKFLMLLTSLLSQVPETDIPRVDFGPCISLQHPSSPVSLVLDDQPYLHLTLPIEMGESPKVVFNTRFQLEYPNMTYYVDPETDFALFSEYSRLEELNRDLNSLEGADAYFSFHDPLSNVGDTLKCSARLVAGSLTMDQKGYAHVRLF